MSKIKLNRRHKAALCSTLICVGLILLLSTDFRAPAGILVLGIAYSWALGSDTRVVHWLFLSVGVLLLLAVVLDTYMWQRGKPELVSLYTSTVVSAQSGLDSDISANSRFRQTVSTESLAKDYEELSKAQAELAMLTREKPLQHAVTNDWGSLAGGLLLLGSGVGLTIGLREKKALIPKVDVAPVPE